MIDHEKMDRYEKLKIKRAKEHLILRAVLNHPKWPSTKGHFDPEKIVLAYESGLIPSHRLKDGTYYFGQCRNAQVAKWDATRECFTYIRTKFGTRFPEDINGIEKDNGYDLFLPVAEINPEPEEIVL